MSVECLFRLCSLVFDTRILVLLCFISSASEGVRLATKSFWWMCCDGLSKVNKNWRCDLWSFCDCCMFWFSPNSWKSSRRCVCVWQWTRIVFCFFRECQEESNNNYGNEKSVWFRVAEDLLQLNFGRDVKIEFIAAIKLGNGNKNQNKIVIREWSKIAHHTSPHTPNAIDWFFLEVRCERMCIVSTLQAQYLRHICGVCACNSNVWCVLCRMGRGCAAAAAIVWCFFLFWPYGYAQRGRKQHWHAVCIG